ncbi:hypothetical protein F5884DRAFT_763305 [Xylogone sp. PMI_703]|nr:hypothetical protein F5884DRAFT_763305 [Xylogone sp. PMI_703]
MDASSIPIWKRFIRFRGEDGKIYCGEPIDTNVDVGLALLENKDIFARVLDTDTALDYNARFTGETKKVVVVLSPLAAEAIGTIRCIGVNYKDHGAELDFEVPPVPIVFLKPETSLLDPSAPLVLPHLARNDSDYEVELGVIIGRTCKNVSVAEALSYVLGYVTTNDVTARGVQFITSQFCYAKGFDGFTPMGPTLVSSSAIPDPSVLELKTTLNGTIMQQSSVRNMIFSVPQIISHLSQGTTLKPGTVIITGTPGGIGHSRVPAVYLSQGDELRIWISHGLGTLTNPIEVEKSE